MSDRIRIHRGGSSTIVAISLEGVDLAAYLPDHLSAEDVKAGILAGSVDLANTALEDPKIDATADADLELEIDEDHELVADGGQELPEGYEPPSTEPVELRDGDRADEDNAHARRNLEQLEIAKRELEECSECGSLYRDAGDALECCSEKFAEAEP